MQKQAAKPTNSDPRRRRQRRFNLAVLTATLIVIVAVTVYALSKPQAPPLPAYLDRCIPLNGPYVYTESFKIFIVIGGENQSIPRNIGIVGGCVRPIYTLTSGSGGVHITSDVARTYTLGDFFLVWGSTYGWPYYVFDQDHLWSLTADNGHHIAMTVNNVTSTDYQNYVFPTDASPTIKPLYITITYD